ncbi:MAG: cell surface protein SprA, partial [Bacteroidales bacterium]
EQFIGTDGKDGNPNHSCGKLYFNLGDISEDVLKDGRKAFENGMPISSVPTNLDSTQWGRVPRNQSIVRAFDNDPNTRQYQDIGLDGLNDEDERSFFQQYLQEIENTLGRTSIAYTQAFEDPSADNYHYFRGGNYDQMQSPNQLLDRYKQFNNPQGNSPSSTQNKENFPTQQTNYPNTEEISGDNTLSEGETYFQYEVELDPDKMRVGEGFITDIQEKNNVKLLNNKTTSVRWYQFKIPIRSPNKVVGQIQNFQSIRFIRMFMKGFSEDIVLRFASLDLVKSDWRKYQSTLLDDNIHVSSNGTPTQVNVSVVSIEENGQRQPVPYVLPPGLERLNDVGSQNSRQLNEQSLSLQILNLADGDARGVYKTTNFDFRQFKHLQMFVHLEKIKEMESAVNGDVSIFIRIGADFQENYYEYELPLEYTQWGESASDLVWPQANKVDINLEELVKIKEHRNAAMRSGNDRINYTTPYKEKSGNITYTVKGTPTISDVKTILIGIRNPQKNRLNDLDDGQAKSVEVWFNELSLNEFNKKGGTAATVRMQATLGDLGNISVSGAYSTANFGDIEQRITELPKDNIVSFDVATNLELGKFVPEKVGMKIPFHYDVSAIYSNPEYNPLDPDVRTANDLATYSPEEKKKIKEQIQDYTFRQNVNLMNVRKERTNAEKLPQFYDIENFNVSYSYSQISRRNIDIEYDNKFTHKGGFGYDYSTSPKYFEPFAKTKLAKNKAFAILTDLNFNYIPNQFSFTTEIWREFNENKMRNKSFGDILIEPTFFKRYDWTRTYIFKYDITKSISIAYNANANSYIQEPPGKIDTKDKRDSVWRSFIGFGTRQLFTQNFNATYKLPINKIPFLNWINGDLSYASLYRWEASPISVQQRLGNTISNNMSTGVNGTVDLVQLYNKVPFLKKINSPQNRRRTQQRTSNVTLAKDTPTIKEDPEIFKKIYSAVLRVLMGVRNAGVSWNVNRGTILPGFMPAPDLFGTNFNLGAPGIPFAFGSQKDIREKAVLNDWLTKDSLLNAGYMNTRTESLTARALFEPFSDFRIDINLGYSKASNQSSYFKYDETKGAFVDMNPTGTGNYTVTSVMIATSFSKMDANYVTEVYQNFLDYREIIARRLSAQNPNSNGHPDVYDTATGKYYPYGYGSNAQEVMIPALIAAYTGADPAKMSMNGLSRFPLPNWSLSYSGLTKIKGVKKVFKNIILQHAYTSSYNVGVYTQNILYTQDLFGNATALDMNRNFIAYQIMDGISMMEQFSPLIKVNLTMNNDLSVNFEMRKMRQINLSFVNNQLTEMQSDEWIIGLGYRIKDVGFKISSFGKSKKEIKSDIVLRADFSIRDNKTILRKIDQNVYMPSAGARITSLNIYAEYEITKQLVARVFYDLILNKPYIENSFFNTSGKGGLSLTYRFNQ